MKGIKTLKINIWKYINMEEINEKLDKEVKHKFIPTEIKYNCLKIDKKGNLFLKAEFKKGIW